MKLSSILRVCFSSKLLIASAMGLFMVFAFGAVAPAKVHAELYPGNPGYMNPNDSRYNGLPSDVRQTAADNCNGHNSAGYPEDTSGEWISAEGDQTNDYGVVANYGDQSIPLQLNYVSIHCPAFSGRNASNATRFSQRTNDSSPNIPELTSASSPNHVYDVNLQRQGKTEPTIGVVAHFSTAFDTTIDHGPNPNFIITYHYQSVTQYGGTYYCGSTSRGDITTSGGIHGFDPTCENVGGQFRIQVTVNGGPKVHIRGYTAVLNGGPIFGDSVFTYADPDHNPLENTSYAPANPFDYDVPLHTANNGTAHFIEDKDINNHAGSGYAYYGWAACIHNHAVNQFGSETSSPCNNFASVIKGPNGFDMNFDFNGAGDTVDVRFFYVPTPRIDGVVIDNTGVADDGNGYTGPTDDASPTRYGGNMLFTNNNIGEYSPEDAHGTRYDDQTTNPFSFKPVSPGKYFVTDLSVNDHPGYKLVGYSSCIDGPNCTSQFLTRTDQIHPGNGFVTDNLQSNQVLHVRFIYKLNPRDPTTGCTNASGCCNAAIDPSCGGGGPGTHNACLTAHCESGLAVCALSTTGEGVIYGNAYDPDSSGTQLNYKITGANGYSKTGTTAGAPHSGDYVQSIPSSFNLQDGSRHDFSVTFYGVDVHGATDMHDETVLITMKACGKAALTGTSTIKLHDNDEAPTNYTSTGTIIYAFDPIVTGTELRAPTLQNVSCAITIKIKGTTLPPRACPPNDGGPGVSIFNSTGTGQLTGPTDSIGPGYMAGDQYCSTITYGYGTAILGEGETTPLYTGSSVTSDPSCDHITARPFYKVLNSSVTAGGSVEDCSGTGALGGWVNTVSSSDIYGSTADMGAYALTKIAGFASANYQHSAAGHSPTDASFANSPATSPLTDPISALLGGEIGGSNCLTKPSTAPTGTAVTTASSVGTSVGSLLSGGAPVSMARSYKANVNLGGGTVAAGQNLAIYVTGNVSITGPITLGAASSLSDVPSFVLVATGNIYIDPSVTQLDGVYEAQKTITAPIVGGNIYTCAHGMVPAQVTHLYNDCNKQLIVHGSFLADKVNLLRTFGSLHNDETATGTCDNSGAAAPGLRSPVCAAEVFDFSPAQYLMHPAVQPAAAGARQYDAITSLPPVL